MRGPLTLAAAFAAITLAGCGSAHQTTCARAWKDAVRYTQHFAAGLPTTPSAQSIRQLEVATFTVATAKYRLTCTIPAP